jgi:hypothetical protein
MEGLVEVGIKKSNFCLFEGLKIEESRVVSDAS